MAALSFSHAGERLVALLHGADPRAVYWHWRSGSEAQILGYNVAMDGPTTWLLALPDAPSGYAQLLTGNAQMLRFWTGSSEGMTSIDAAPATAAEGATCLLEVPTPPVDGAADGGGRLVHAVALEVVDPLLGDGEEEAVPVLVLAVELHLVVESGYLSTLGRSEAGS